MSSWDEMLVLTDPQVTDIHASQVPTDEEHLLWRVGYAPVDYPHAASRVVFGTIHVGGATGLVEVSVASMMAYDPRNEPGADFERVLAKSGALETLWDIGRIALYAAAGLARVDVLVPTKAPDAEFRTLSRADGEEVQSASEPLENQASINE